MYLELVQSTLINSVEALDVAVSVALESGPVEGGLLNSDTTSTETNNKCF